MKTAYLLASTMVLVLLAGCEAASSPAAVSPPTSPPQPEFQIAPSAKRTLVEKAVTLRPGDSYQTVTNALGMPTFDQSLGLKDGRNIGRGLSYYAVMRKTNLVNELQDERVLVYLDERGRVSAVHIKVMLE